MLHVPSVKMSDALIHSLHFFVILLLIIIVILGFKATIDSQTIQKDIQKVDKGINYAWGISAKTLIGL
jgi:hypothetical protein